MNKLKLKNYRTPLSDIQYQVNISKDGDAWCALIGNNLQDGLCGFGDTIAEALIQLGKRLDE